VQHCGSAAYDKAILLQKAIEVFAVNKYRKQQQSTDAKQHFGRNLFNNHEIPGIVCRLPAIATSVSLTFIPASHCALKRMRWGELSSTARFVWYTEHSHSPICRRTIAPIIASIIVCWRVGPVITSFRLTSISSIPTPFVPSPVIIPRS